ncbi:MAG: hypothetical protein ACRDGR_05375, partial [bacterium]
APLAVAAIAAFASPAGAADKFEDAAVRLEQNATDGDNEVVLEIKSGTMGIDHLSVVAPDGHTVFELSCPAPAALGLRQFVLESPEPKDRVAIQKAFPAGTYVVRGRTVDGRDLEASAELVHDLPPTAGFVHPAEDAEDVPAEDLVITWKGVAGIAAYEIEVEDEETGVVVTARLPARATSFGIPAGFLEAGGDYKLAIGTVAADGNKSFVETSFTTAE